MLLAVITRVGGAEGTTATPPEASSPPSAFFLSGTDDTAGSEFTLGCKVGVSEEGVGPAVLETFAAAETNVFSTILLATPPAEPEGVGPPAPPASFPREPRTISERVFGLSVSAEM